jgi:hypothetical protein
MTWQIDSHSVSRTFVDWERLDGGIFRVDDTRRSTADIISAVKDLWGKFVSWIDWVERIVGVTTRTPTCLEIFNALRGIHPSIVFESAGRFVVWEWFDFWSELCQQNFGFDRPQEDWEGLLLEIQMAVQDAIVKLR